MAVHRRRRGGDPPLDPPPPPQTKVTIAGKNEIYNRENLVGPFFGTQTFGSQTPPPPPLPHWPGPTFGAQERGPLYPPEMLRCCAQQASLVGRLHPPSMANINAAKECVSLDAPIPPKNAHLALSTALCFVTIPILDPGAKHWCSPYPGLLRVSLNSSLAVAPGRSWLSTNHSFVTEL